MATPARAAPLDYDCDTPADHLGSIVQPLAGPATIAGTVMAKSLRAGAILPAGGVRLESGDGMTAATLKFVADTPAAKDLEVRLLLRIDGRETAQVLGRAPIGQPIAFTLAVAPTGTATATAAGLTASAPLLALAAPKAAAFCATAQFKFTALALGGN